MQCMGTDADLISQLLAFAQGQITQKRLANWCREQRAVWPPGVVSLVHFLVDPVPNRALELLSAAGALREWLAQAQHLHPAQRMLLQRGIGGLCLEAAALLMHAQRYAAADALSLLVLDLAPELSEAWLLLIQLMLLQGRGQQAQDTLLDALELFPTDIKLLSLQAQLWLQHGQGQQALARFEQLVRQRPTQPEAWLGLGNLRHSLGDLSGVKAAYSQALILAPNHPGILNNYGQIQHRLLDHDAALRAYQMALSQAPGLVEAWNNLAALYLDQADLVQARAALSRALSLQPGYAPAWVNAGVLEGLGGNLDAARQHFARARELAPQLPEAWREEAALLLEHHSPQAAGRLLQAGLVHLPANPELCWLSARVLALQHQEQAAEQMGEQALKLAPNPFRVLQLTLGWAEAHFLDPPLTQSSWLTHVSEALRDQPLHPIGPAELLQELRYLPELLWNLTYISDRPFKDLRMALAARFALDDAFVPNPPRRKRLRLGVQVSPGHEGIFMGLGYPLLAQMMDVELVLIGSVERLRPHVNSDCLLLSMPPQLPAAVRKLRSADLDLLYFWEVGSNSLNYFLAFFRLAPVQFTSWGTPLTSGIPNLDYFVSSALTEPASAQDHYSERLLLTPGLPHFCPQPVYNPANRQDLGLPVGPLYVCLQNPLKLSLPFIAALAKLLQQDPDAQILLLGSSQPWVQAKAQAALAPFVASGRLQWLPAPLSRERYLAILAQADVALDTQECSGGLTSDEALMLGVPLVSLPGASARNRLALGRLRALDLDDWAVSDWDAYVKQAMALAHPGPQREAALGLLHARKDRLVQNPESPRQFAALLQQMAQEIGLWD
ncbi:MAG: hypothetical protein CVV27_16845 [Candidatus Melainabacteria bacterium HGW-Melainabacteria-1]|nr:MAG: hypothetical protein CVV27_16845 [Candidatus Melainabacteria bacterium HGW-Melainabacteria-1]